MSGVRQQYVARDEDGMRLDRWFQAHFPQVTFGHLQKLLRSGQVRVDSGRAKSNTRLSSGQLIRIPPLDAAPPRDPDATNPRDAEALRDLILYEDDELYVFNKPHGLASQGGSGVKPVPVLRASRAIVARCAVSASRRKMRGERSL